MYFESNLIRDVLAILSDENEKNRLVLDRDDDEGGPSVPVGVVVESCC